MKNDREKKAKIASEVRCARDISAIARERISQIVSAHTEGGSVANAQEDSSTDLNSGVRDLARRVRANPNDHKLERALFEFVTVLVRSYLVFTVRSLLCRGTSRQEADDLVQESLTRVYEKVGKLARAGQAETWDSPQAYIRRIARTMLMDALKQHRRREFALNADICATPSKADPTKSAIQREEVERMQVALENLKGCDRDVLKLFYVFQLSHDEIGILLGISPAAMRVRKHRALRRLKDAMGEGPEPGD